MIVTIDDISCETQVRADILAVMSTSDAGGSPTVVVLFRSRLTAAALENGYGDMTREMAGLASSMPGFVEEKSFTSEDGEQLTVVWWQDHDTLGAWREHVRHRTAQHLGRERWFESYTMDVATVVRRSRFERSPRAHDGRNPHGGSPA
jgi:heme-degrading monooxygenase HmoA